jgi:hypothetical protein
MALTLKEAATYTTRVMEQSLVQAIMRDNPWAEELRREAEAYWRALPWYKRAYFTTRRWVRSHTPHIHVYLGEHPRDEDY